MSDSKRCKSCGNPVDFGQAKDGACPWCLAAFTFSSESVGTPAAFSGSPKTGKYVRTEKLGAGGMGEVWKALDTELNRWVALKFLREEDPSILARFQREAQTAASLSHPNIAAIYEVGESEGRHFIAMQYVPGKTMDLFAKRDRRLLVRLFRDAASAVDHAHRHGIIHRDLKPENLMVHEREDGWSVMVLDFGLARPIEGGEKLSQSGEVYGTAAYMSPEQAQGQHLDERADVYSLGATMYDVLTGRPPFQGTNILEVLRKVGAEEPAKLRKFDPRIHRDLETIVLKCLEKQPDRRYATARELAEDLERFLNSEPIVARPPSTLYRLRMKLGKRRAQVVAGAALVGLIATAAVIIPNWLREAAARQQMETAAREKRERLERARPHLEAGRKTVQRMTSLRRGSYQPEDLKKLAAQAQAEVGRALALAPEMPEALYEAAGAYALAGDSERALQTLDRTLAADAQFTPAYLYRVLLRIDDYERMRHHKRGTPLAETAESKALRERLESDLGHVERFSTEYPQQRYAQALIAFSNGDFAKAAEEFEKYLQREPEDGRAHYWRGHALYHLRRYPETIEACDRALACNTRDAAPLSMRGLAKMYLKDYPGAIADFDRSIEYRQDPSSAYFNRGNAKRESGDLRGAIADYDRAIESKKDFADAIVHRGRVKKTLGDLAGALADFTHAIELNPKEADFFSLRGVLYWDQSRLDEAIADHTQAIRLNPNSALAYSNRGIARAAKGLLDEAIADHTKAIQLEPKYGAAYNNRGVAKVDKGLLDDAIEDYSKAIEIDPNDSGAFYNRGRARAAKGLFDDAMEDHTRAIALEPKNPDYHLNLGIARAAKGRFDEAIADFTTAIDLDSKYVLGYTHRGRAKESKRQYDEAIEDFTKAVDLNPKSADAYNDRGIALEWAKRFDEAIEDYDRAIALAPKNPHAYLNRGSAKDSKGDFTSGDADYRKCLELAPPNWPNRAKVEARLALPADVRLFREGNRLSEAKKHEAAIGKFKALLEDHPESRGAKSAAYNIACAYAILGEKKNALDWLEKAVEKGWDQLKHLESDADLESLRSEERYKKVVERLKTK